MKLRRRDAENERCQGQRHYDRILRDPEVEEKCGLSRTTRWRLVKVGKFPKPIKLTDHAIGWRESSIDDWLASREEVA